MIYRLYIYNILLFKYYPEKWHKNIFLRLNQSTRKAHFYNCIKFKLKQLFQRYNPGVHLQLLLLVEILPRGTERKSVMSRLIRQRHNYLTC